MTPSRIYFVALAFLCVIMAMVLGIRQAAAQTQCAPHADVVAGLARNYGEVAMAMGIAANGHMIEVFISPTGSWTITGTDPLTGVTCMIAAGAGWASIPQGVMG